MALSTQNKRWRELRLDDWVYYAQKPALVVGVVDGVYGRQSIILAVGERRTKVHTTGLDPALFAATEADERYLRTCFYRAFGH